MRRYSPPYRSPPRRGYGGRERSPPRRRGYGGGYGGRREQSNGSLLVRNIPLNCREPRGFAFVQFVDPYDASEAQYHMNGQLFGGREITVVLAAESRKRPEEMRNRDRIRGPSGYAGRRYSYYGRSRSGSVSRSRSPRRPSASTRRRSRSYSPVPRRRGDYSISPQRRRSVDSRSPRGHRQEQNEDERHPYSPEYDGADNHKQAGNGYDRKGSYDEERSPRNRSPRRSSVSPPGSRSRSADLSPGRSRSR